jgi:hypothetical protein
MANCFKYISPYISIFWTKRFVRHRPAGVRGTLRRLRYENRVTKRKTWFQIKCEQESKRIGINLSIQRRNYNSHYRPMQIPV